MRGFLTFIGVVLLAALAVFVVLFAVANPANATYTLLGNRFTMPIWLPVALAAALGLLLTLLALSPAVGDSRANALERERTLQLERQLAEQHSANEALQGRVAAVERERDGLLNEREGVLARADRAEAAALAAIRSGSTDAAPTDGRSLAERQALADEQAPVVARTDTAVPTNAMRDTAGTVQTDSAANAQTDTPNAALSDGAVDERQFESTPAQDASPTLGERLRSIFGSPNATTDPNATPDNTPNATA